MMITVSGSRYQGLKKNVVRQFPKLCHLLVVLRKQNMVLPLWPNFHSNFNICQVKAANTEHQMDVPQMGAADKIKHVT